MPERIEYAVTMYRPDRKRPVIRRLYEDKLIPTSSVRQLAGFLTHKLFADKERGGTGTYYVVKINFPRDYPVEYRLAVYTVRKTADGEYQQV